MKFLRILISFILLLLVVAAIAFACLTYFVDPNKLKPMIAQEVLRESGYELKIDGDLTWSLYPRLGVKMEHITLREPGHPQPFVEGSKVTIVTDLSRLWHGEQKMQGEVYIGDLRLMKLKMQQAYVGMHWEKGIVILEPIKANLYNGSLNGVAHGFRLSTLPKWDWSMQANQVDLRSLLDDVNGPKSKIVISGTGQIKMTAETEGKTKDELFKNVNGITEFNLSQGIVEGLDIDYLVQTANAILNGKSLTVPEHIEKTTFQSLTGTAAIKNGVANINNLILISQSYTVSGTGNIDLVRQQLDYKLLVTPLQAEKIRWNVPILISGDLHRPSVHVDSEGLKSIVANEQFHKLKTKVEEKVKELPAKADKLLKKWLGG